MPAHSDNETVDTFRILAQNQDDISAFDLRYATIWYEGPAEGVDMLLAHSSLHFESFDIAESVDTALSLVWAIRCYSRTFFSDNGERKQWEPLIQRFIHKGADIHVPVLREGYNPSKHFPFHVNDYGTPLDVLFHFIETPDEARIIGAEWLGLLASEGLDVAAYLKKEMSLHAPEHQMTYPDYYLSHELRPPLRELRFAFDDGPPCLWWDWWLDPASDIDLLEREFRQIVKHTGVLADQMVPFLVDTWPFQYPVWDDNPEKFAQDYLHKYLRPADRRRRAYLAMQRANRRLEKRYAKDMYSKGLRHSKMPGAWPASSWD